MFTFILNTTTCCSGSLRSLPTPATLWTQLRKQRASIPIQRAFLHIAQSNCTVDGGANSKKYQLFLSSSCCCSPHHGSCGSRLYKWGKEVGKLRWFRVENYRDVGRTLLDVTHFGHYPSVKQTLLWSSFSLSLSLCWQGWNANIESRLEGFCWRTHFRCGEEKAGNAEPRWRRGHF